jgi:hypothetical protein
LVKVQKFSKDIGAPQVLHVAKNLDTTSHTSNIHIPFQQSYFVDGGSGLLVCSDLW